MNKKRTLTILIVVVLAIASFLIYAWNRDKSGPASDPTASTGGQLPDHATVGEPTESDGTQSETESAQNEPTMPSDSAQATKPDEATSNTKPEDSQGSTKPDAPQETIKPDKELSYEQYNAMTGAQQQAFFESFSNVEAFFEWYNAAKQEYDEANKDIVIGGDATIDMGDILNGKN